MNDSLMQFSFCHRLNTEDTAAVTPHGINLFSKYFNGKLQFNKNNNFCFTKKTIFTQLTMVIRKMEMVLLVGSLPIRGEEYHFHPFVPLLVSSATMNELQQFNFIIFTWEIKLEDLYWALGYCIWKRIGNYSLDLIFDHRNNQTTHTKRN